MPQFITRVELHSATGEDYEKLHRAMANDGFSRTILSGDRKSYRLPTAEYNITASATATQIRDRARTAANTTGRRSWVLTTEAGAIAWYLDEA